MAEYEVGGVLRSRTGPVLPGVAPSNVYPTASGEHVVIAVNADSVFARLCIALGESELAQVRRCLSSRPAEEHHDLRPVGTGTPPICYQAPINFELPSTTAAHAARDRVHFQWGTSSFIEGRPAEFTSD